MTKQESKTHLKERVKFYRLRKVSLSNFTNEQFDEFRELLETQRHLISEEKKRLSNGLKSELCLELEPGRSGNHIADTNPENHPIMENIIGNRDKRLEKIDEALQHLNNGTYGVCLTCEKPIPIGRLLSTPIAHLCTFCKEERKTRPKRAPTAPTATMPGIKPSVVLLLSPKPARPSAVSSTQTKRLIAHNAMRRFYFIPLTSDVPNACRCEAVGKAELSSAEAIPWTAIISRDRHAPAGARDDTFLDVGHVKILINLTNFLYLDSIAKFCRICGRT